MKNKMPLHLAQQEIYFDQILNPEDPGYNLGGYVTMRGQIDKEVFRKIMKDIPNVFDVFRMRFDFSGPEPACKFVEGEVVVDILEKDFSKEQDPRTAANAWVTKMFDTSFDLNQEILTDQYFLQISADETWWFFRFHHLISDGHGLAIFYRYVAEQYNKMISGSEEEVTTSYAPYEDEIQDSVDYLGSKTYEKDKAYWNEKLSDLPEPLFETRYPENPEKKFGRVFLPIDQDKYKRIATAAQETGTSIQQLLLAALTLYFGRVKDRSSLLIGTPLHKRRNHRQKNIVGSFSGNLPFKSAYDPNQNLADLIVDIKRQQRQEYRCQGYPISHLSRDLKLLSRGSSQLFDIIVVIHIFDFDLGIEGTESSKSLMVGNSGDGVPLLVRWRDHGATEPLELTFDYQCSCFTEEEVELLINRISFILGQMADKLDQPVSAIDIIPQEEREILLGQRPAFNGTFFNEGAKELANDQTINVRFEAMADQYKDEIAVVHGTEKWTFNQINDLANQIGNTLQVQGVKAGEFVGVFHERTPQLFASILGILKCGAIYVPMDTQNPKERIHKMIEGSEASAIITTNSKVGILENSSVKRLLLTDEFVAENWSELSIDRSQIKDAQDIARAATGNLPNVNDMRSWAYMLYTSGSTGAPKGAITRHDGAMNHILAEYDEMELPDGFRFLQSAAIGSDISVWQILGPLLKGGTSVIIEKFDLLDFEFFLDFVQKERIDVIETVPSYLWGLTDHIDQLSTPPALNHVQWIMVQGEAAPVALVNQWREAYPNIRLLNAYGPCEASDDVVQFEIKEKVESKIVPIGRPIANMNVAVLDTDGNLCPIGVEGELCITGVGVGAGYKGLPEKTAASFVKNEFPELLGDTLYKTGDLARWLSDGNLEFLGRIDRQVKILGNRVELGEIESLLRQDAKVKAAHLSVCKDATNSDAMVAFIVADQGQSTTKAIETTEQSEKEAIELTAEQREELIYGFNNTTVDFSTDKTFVDLFEEQVARTPDNIALVYEDNQLTYTELNEKANQLANYLRDKGVKEETLVAICVDRSLEMIIGVLGIVKAGGVYVPIDPTYPQGRIDYLIADANAELVVCHQKYASLFESSPEEAIILIDEDWFLIKEASIEAPSIDLKPEHLMYINYTSGTTGYPKGVAVEHRTVVNVAQGWIDAYQLDANSSSLQVASISFDVFTGDLCRGLLSGGKLVVLDKETMADFDRFYTRLKQYQVNVMDVVPSFGFGLLDYAYELELDLSWMKLLAVGSDRCPVKDFKVALERYGDQFRIINSYGTTETTIDSCFFEAAAISELEGLKSIPIGKPMQNTSLYVLNEQLEPVAVGEEGEIYIGGVGMARAYWKRADLTAEKFVDNPFANGKMYRTGDLGRWMADGNLECLGRIDNQVSIDGHRIELGGIEVAVERLDGIAKSVVIAKGEKSIDRKLIAYVVSDQAVDKKEILNQLGATLPTYMLPKAIVQLDELPLTPNGKIDRKFLKNLEMTDVIKKDLQETCYSNLPAYMRPAYYCFIDKMPTNVSDKVDEKALQEIFKQQHQSTAEIDYVNDNFVAARNPIEEALTKIWAELLNIQDISVEDNFFELGGHSLKANQLGTSIYKLLGRKLSIKDIFDNPTIAGQAAIVSEVKEVAYEAIPKVEEQLFYPISNAQKRLWIIDQIEEDLIAYNSFGAFKLEGALDIDLFTQSVAEITNRHEIFRTTFTEVNGEPRQRIHAIGELDLGMNVVDWRTKENATNDILAELQNQGEQSMDLEKGPLFKCRLYLLPDNKHYFFILMHHIICDGWSINLLIKELIERYAQLKENAESVAAAASDIQYKDYACWQLAQLETEAFQAHKDFWFDLFSGEIPILHFPSYKERPKVQTYGGKLIHHQYGPKLSKMIAEISERNGASTFSSLLALVNILLYKYTAQKDIIIGAATSGRNHPDLEDQLGYYINTIAIRNQLDTEKTFSEFLAQVKNTTLECLEHEDYPFDLLINELDYDRDVSRNPLFDVMLTLQNPDDDEGLMMSEYLKDLEVSDVQLGKDASPFDLDFDFFDSKDGLALQLAYNTKVYEASQMELLITHFERLVEVIHANNNGKIGETDILLDAEKDQIVNEFNDTQKDLPLDKTYIHYLEQFAAETPEQIAVTYNDTSLSYKTLNENANALARRLDEAVEMEANDIVGVFMSRSEKMKTAILSIWKTAGAYIPLDRKFPDNRILTIAKDAGVKAIIAEKALMTADLAEALDAHCKVLYYEDLVEAAATASTENLDKYIDPDSLAYILYTSGSTGQPKGAMNQHIGMINHAIATVDCFEMDTSTVLVQNASHVFDISVWQFFTALIPGGKTVVYDDELVGKPAQLLERLKSDKVTVFQLVPSYLSMLLDLIRKEKSTADYSLEYLMCCGEAAKADSVRECFRLFSGLKFVNDYGPAEASDGTSFYIVDHLDPSVKNVSIGESIYNIRTYIVDDYMNLCPVGVLGEIYVAGLGVGLGYINDEEKTKAKFSSDPFDKNNPYRMYKTGDLGRYLPNGLLEFHGRKDYQVKVNGQRIEMGEIEAKLEQLPVVKAAAVVDKVDQNDRKYLTGFIVFNEEASNSLQEVKELLAKELPAFMIPRVFHELETLPTNNSGKVNRKLLKELDDVMAQEETPYVGPENEVEELLVLAWRHVLKVDRISMHDNFYDLGGDSISAIQIGSFMYREGYKAEIKDIMRQGTIRSLAPYIKGLNSIAFQGATTGYVPLTPIQKDFFNYQKKNPNHYNQDITISSTTGLSEVFVEQTLRKLFEIHDVLRMKYVIKDGEVQQFNQDLDAAFHFELCDLRNAENPREEMEKIANELQAAKDLENGPLMTTALFRLPESDDLFISIHHLVVDGVSWRIILDDFTNIYQQLEAGELLKIPIKTHSFKLWSEQLRKHIYSSEFQEERTYWEEALKNEFTSIPFEFRHENIELKLNEVESYSFQLSSEDTQNLLTQARTAFTTNINDLLLTALGLSVKEYFGMDRLSLMLESHGRSNLSSGLNIDRTVGWFTSEFPVELDMSEDRELGKQIVIVKEHLHRISNEGIGYGLLTKLVPDFDVPANKPQIIFNYLGQMDQSNGNDAFQVTNSLGNAESIENELEFPLEMIGIAQDGRLEMRLFYHPTQFNKATIREWMDIYKEKLQIIIDHCIGQEGKSFTPSDFDYKGLSIDGLEELESLFS